MKELFFRFRRPLLLAALLILAAVLLTGCGPMIIEDGGITSIGG